MKIFDPELVERCGKERQESRIQRELSLRGKHHASLVKILDGGCCPDTGLLFVAMELIEFPNLATVIQDVPRERIWSIISQIASAALFLEGLELAHRDIKPDNIAVSLDFQKAILLDLGVLRPFGVADLTDEEERAFIGTLQYSSPEFLFRKEQDTAEGWRALTFYQLGAVLHDMIMRKRLFSEFADPFARLVKAVEYDLPKIEAADVLPDLVFLTKNCLTKDPSLRLRLVHWADFEPREIAPFSAADAKERIRKRRAVAQALAPTRYDAEEERRARGLRQTIEVIQGKLQELARAECISSELFPPMELHEFQEESPDQSSFMVLLCASIEHALPISLGVWFKLDLLDPQSEALQLRCAAAVGPHSMNREALTDDAMAVVFEGVFEESVIKSVIQSLLYPLLDSAQQVEPNEVLREDIGGMRWLDVPKPLA